MYFKLMLTGLLVMTMSCKKDKDKAEIPLEKTVAQLLTQKEWILTAVGFDDNKNGVLDPSENTIQDCHKDNSYIFNIAGTGSTFDNSLSCGGSPSFHFNWKLLSNDTQLEIASERMVIFSLNETEMRLSPEIPGLAVRFFMTYRH